jgi:hypothetical protein
VGYYDDDDAMARQHTRFAGIMIIIITHEWLAYAWDGYCMYSTIVKIIPINSP